MYPLTLGVNIGTAITGLLVASVVVSNIAEALQVELSPLLINIIVNNDLVSLSKIESYSIEKGTDFWVNILLNISFSVYLYWYSILCYSWNSVWYYLWS